MNRVLAAAATFVLTVAGLTTFQTATASPAHHRPHHHPHPYTPPPVHWKACNDGGLLDAIGAQCAMVKVPLSYRHPHRRKIEIAISRLRHTSSRARYQGVVLVNPGGPGGSGLYLSVLGYPGIIPGRASGTYDWIGFDPRGVGASVPSLSCDSRYFGYNRPRYEPTTAAVDKAWLDRTRGYARDCKHAPGARLLRHVRTTDTVHDMESIRRALHQRKLNFYGFSYGTYLAQVYATRHPHQVRRFVLDSTVDPRGVWYGDNFAQDVAFQKTIEVYFGWLAAHDGVFHLGTDPAAIAKQYYDALNTLEATPAAGGTVGPDELADVMLSAGYYVYGWEDVGFAYSAAIKDGDWSGIQYLYGGGAPQTKGSDNGYAMYLGTTCTDARMTRDGSTWRRDSDAMFLKAPFLTWGNTRFNQPCRFWPARQHTRVHVTGRRVHVPVLMIDETFDAATPYSGSLEVRKRFPSASLIEGVDGTTHAGSLSGVACTDNAIGAYLANGTVPRRSRGNHSDLQCPPVPQPDPQPEPPPAAAPPATASPGVTLRRAESSSRRVALLRDAIHDLIRSANP
jgi:pimeloyl-ACP methyl ester carboxylesterase